MIFATYIFLECFILYFQRIAASPVKKVKTPSHTDINQLQIAFRINILK